MQLNGFLAKVEQAHSIGHEVRPEVHDVPRRGGQHPALYALETGSPPKVPVAGFRGLMADTEYHSHSRFTVSTVSAPISHTSDLSEGKRCCLRVLGCVFKTKDCHGLEGDVHLRHNHVSSRQAFQTCFCFLVAVMWPLPLPPPPTKHRRFPSRQ